MIDWLRNHAWTVAAVSAAMFLTSLLALPILVTRMRADYFVRPRPVRRERAHPLLGISLFLARNVLGGLLLLAGVAMLVLPGQGVLTILIALTLIDFPGKRALELRIVRQPGVRRAIDWIRRRAGKPALELPGSPTDPPSSS